MVMNSLKLELWLSSSLVAVISQALVPKVVWKGPASEILVVNHAIANLIREDKVHQIYSAMQLGQENTGMQTQNQVLIQFVKQGTITKMMRYSFPIVKMSLESS